MPTSSAFDSVTLKTTVTIELWSWWRRSTPTRDEFSRWIDWMCCSRRRGRIQYGSALGWCVVNIRSIFDGYLMATGEIIAATLLRVGVEWLSICRQIGSAFSSHSNYRSVAFWIVNRSAYCCGLHWPRRMGILTKMIIIHLKEKKKGSLLKLDFDLDGGNAIECHRVELLSWMRWLGVWRWLLPAPMMITWYDSSGFPGKLSELLHRWAKLTSAVFFLESKRLKWWKWFNKREPIVCPNGSVQSQWGQSNKQNWYRTIISARESRVDESQFYDGKSDNKCKWMSWRDF